MHNCRSVLALDSRQTANFLLCGGGKNRVWYTCIKISVQHFTTVRVLLITADCQSFCFVQSERCFRILLLCQSAAINNYPDCSGTLCRNLNASVPDPIFATPTQKISSSLSTIKCYNTSTVMQ